MALAIKALAWLAMAFLVTALALFLPAGTVLWPAGWIDLILVYGFLLVGILLLLKYNPGLLEERLSLSQPNQKVWDKVFILLFNLFFLALISSTIMKLSTVALPRLANRLSVLR